ncbi:MAG: carbohydrate kinase [Sphingobacteriia bacterium]|nr:carbohydrate kinase [Sphingobacteriia bacterium]NCC38834.1 carbohydrate kinase [Gammaproteobacteria bacterium]
MSARFHEPTRSVWIGVDVGTSGCRALAIDAAGQILAVARQPLPAPRCPQPGWAEQDPALWWDAVLASLSALAVALPADARPVALGVDATSATLLLATPDGTPCTPALMYNDQRAHAAAARIARAAPSESAARGASSSLAKLLHLQSQLGHGKPLLALHQADWVAGRLCASHGVSDWNNALKLGYDAASARWPDWVRALVPARVRLPWILTPGTRIGQLDAPLADQLGWPRTLEVVAGTTDSTAAAIAAGVARPGDAVTSLGSTLVLKVVSAHPVTASDFGVYSHRLGDVWLVGGASNSGGAVLSRHFSASELVTLSAAIDPASPSGLDYYPLSAVGERFPRNDPALAPRLLPRPAQPQAFLHGLLEGIARIEAEGYARLAELGAPRPRRILSIGGGAANPVWTQMRERIIGIPVCAAPHQDAAYGTALLARGRL